MSNLFVHTSSLTTTTAIFNAESIKLMFSGQEFDLSNSETVASLGLAPVADPSNTQSDDSVLVASVDQSGNWTSTWTPISDYRSMLNNIGSEINVRKQRDKLLADCDWTHTTDSQLTTEQKTAWAVYRQALRDITTQEHFPNGINWPKLPT